MAASPEVAPIEPQRRLRIGARLWTVARLGRRLLSASWPAIVWGLLLARCLWLRNDRPARSALYWGLLILFSFIAWGTVLTRALYKGHAFGWGFHGAVGMSLALTFFGVMSCVRLVSVGAIVLWCGAGPIALAASTWMRSSSRAPPKEVSRARALLWLRSTLTKPRPIVFAAGLAVLYVMAALHYVRSGALEFNGWDDNMAYRSFAREFLDTGWLYEPFSYRHIGAYGGQSLLQAMVLALSGRERLHILDNGICIFLLLGLITGFRTAPRSGARAAVLAAGALALTLPHVPHNVGSERTGVVLFLALFRLFDNPRFEDAPSHSNAILTGVLAAGACTLRQNYISATIAFVAFVYFALVLFPGTKGRVVRLKHGVVAAAATIVFLTPWLVVSYLAVHTPFYPIIKGNVRPDFGIVGKISKPEALRWTLENLLFLKPIQTLGLFYLAAFTLPLNRRNRAVHALLFGTATAFAMMMYFFQKFDQPQTIARYYFPFTLAFAIAVTLRSLGEVASKRRVGTAFVAGGLVAAAVGMQIVAMKDDLQTLYAARITAFEDLLENDGPAPPYSLHDDFYRRIQDSVPAGAPILVMLDEPYLLDGKRNPLFVYDHPGAMGPSGGPPCFQGPEAFATYMHSVGVRYIAYQLGPSSPEYQRQSWEARAAAADPDGGRGGFYKRQAHFELDFFDVITALSSSRHVLFAEAEVKVLDLEAVAP